MTGGHSVNLFDTENVNITSYARVCVCVWLTDRDREYK